jgi:hypothetical protein
MSRDAKLEWLKAKLIVGMFYISFPLVCADMQGMASDWHPDNERLCDVDLKSS